MAQIASLRVFMNWIDGRTWRLLDMELAVGKRRQGHKNNNVLFVLRIYVNLEIYSYVEIGTTSIIYGVICKTWICLLGGVLKILNGSSKMLINTRFYKTVLYYKIPFMSRSITTTLNIFADNNSNKNKRV